MGRQKTGQTFCLLFATRIHGGYAGDLAFDRAEDPVSAGDDFPHPAWRSERRRQPLLPGYGRQPSDYAACNGYRAAVVLKRRHCSEGSQVSNCAIMNREELRWARKT
jgi:hypothetical protein